ncbi:MAG: AAA family ATPase [Pirellulales bacterium]|nr:AAA family ATPase [Pirellulales bacterium]
MSIKDETSALEHGTNGSSLIVQRHSAMGPVDIEWPSAPASQVAGMGDAFAYLHAVRRHWLLGLMMGIVCAAALGAIAWAFLPRTYTAMAYIRIAMQKPSLTEKERRINPQEFQSDKNTQMVLLKSHLVLTEALRDETINSLPMVEQEKPDEVKWLSSNLRVAFPDDAEIMQISLKGEDKEQVTKIVNAVIHAYKTLVVDNEESQGLANLVEMRRIQDQKAAALRTHEARVKMLIESNNTADPEELRMKRMIESQKLTDYRRELWKAQFKRQELQGEAAAIEASKKRLDGDEQGMVTDLELEKLKQSDQKLREWERALAGLEPMLRQMETGLRSDADKKIFGSPKMHSYAESIKAQYDARVEELVAMMKRAKRQELENSLIELNAQIKILKDSETQLADLIKSQDEAINQLGKSTVEAIMAQHNLDAKKKALDDVSIRVEQLEVEQKSRPRISIQQEAAPPKSYDSPELRIALTVLIGLVGLTLPIALIVLVDVRKQRINSSEEVTKKLGLPVIGSVPLIPGRALRHLNTNAKGDQQWSVRLAESIDSIAARLLRNAAIEGSRVVLITSAVSGEGKTTLATQVATSLARAGRRTVLVDFDLRRPAVDRAFGLPLEPGVSDALCGQTEVENLPHETAAKNLFVVTAGRCDRHALQALSNGADERLFDELRSEFEFVIVDGSPILPVADSRYVSQHVDTVLLSVFRDFSRGPKVMAACEILESFGVGDIEAVVTSSSEDSYGTISTVTA